MKKVLVLIFLISGVAFSQTTVNLQDQCNCEVLSGTAVTTPGATTPAGADIGDIYVNTNTGTIYFWDGDSWELTSSDNQQLQNFTFDPTSNQLTLQLERGGSVSVDLSALRFTETLTTILENTDGTFTYTDENGNTTDIDVSNLETLTTIALNADNTNIDYTDEDGVTTQLDLSAIVANLEALTTIVDNNDGTFTYTDEDGNPTLIDVSNLETLTTIALNADNTNIDYTDEDGVTTQLDLSAIVANLEALTTIVDNNDGTFTYTDEDGNPTLIDVSNLETLTTIALNADNTNIDYTDEDGVTTQLDLSAIVANLEALTTIVDNNDGTFTYTDEDGNPTLIDVSNLETLTTIALNADDTNIDYTDEDGVTTQLDLSAIVANLEALTTIVDNNDGTFTYTDEDGNPTLIDVSNLETLTTIALNADNTNIDYTDEDGVTTQLDLSAIVANLEALTTIVDNNDGTFTYTDEDGNPTLIDVSNLETLTTIALNADNTNIDYTDEDGVTTQLDLSAIVANLEALTTIVDNNDGTFTYTDEDGNPTLIDVSNLETLTTIALNADNTNIDYTDEDGVTTQLDLSAIVANLEALTTIVDNNDGTFTYTDEDGNPTLIDVSNLETLTTIALNADNTNIDYTDEDGVTTQLDLSAIVANLEALTTIVDNNDGTFTYTDEDGNPTFIDVSNLETLTTIALNADNTNIDYTDEDGVTTQLDLSAIVANLEALTTIVDNNDGTFTYTDEDGNPTFIDVSNLETLTTIALNADNTNIDYTDEDGVTTQLDLSAIVANLEALTTIVDNNDGTFTYTDEDGNPTLIDVSNLETLTTIALNADNTNIDYTDEDGVTTQLDLSAIVANLEALTTIVDNNDGTFTYTDEDGNPTLIDVSNLETLTTIALNADDTNIDYTDEDGVTTQLDLSAIVANLEALTTIVDNNDGTFTYTDEDGNPTLIDVSNLETLTTIALNADNTNIDYTDEDGVTTQLDLSAIVANLEALTTIVDNNDGTFTYTDEDGNPTFIDVSNLETLTTIALNADNTNIDYTDEDGVTTQLDLSAIVANLEALTTIVDNNDGTFTYTDEDGNPTLIDVSNLETLTTIALNADNTNIDYTDEDGVTTQLDLSAIVANLEALTTIVDNNDGTFTYTDEDGNPTLIDVSNLETLTTIALNADNTNIDYTDEDGVTTQLDLSAIVANLESVTTLIDNTNGTFTYTSEDGTITTFDSRRAVATDNGDGTFTLTDDSGNTITIDSNDTITNLVNNNDGTITFTNEAGTDQTIDLISNDANNDIVVGSDGGLYLNVASVTISETITDLTDVGDGTVTYVNENGVTQKVNKADLADNGNGTYTFTNGDGTDVLLDTRASSNPYDGTTSGLTATNVQDAIDQVAGGSTDDQQLTLAAGNILTLEDGGTVNLTPFLDNTDNQQITDFSLDNTSNELTLTLEDGGTQTVDFSTILAAADNQQLTLAAGNILTLEDGGTVNLTPFLDNTDNQQITDFSLDNTSNELTLTLEDGGTQTVDFSTILAAADNQQLTLAAGNILTLEDGGTVNLTPFLDNTDNQQITDFSLDNTSNELTLTLEDGGTQTVDFSTILAAADNQQLTLAAGNILTLEDGGTVNLTPFLDNTDNQQITDFSLDGATNILTITLEDGGTQTVNLTGLVGTDDQTAAEVGYDGTTSGLTATNVQAAIDEINTAAGTVALADNGDGSYTFTDAAGGTTTISDTSISTLVNNGDGTFTYTDETGTSVTINLISADANNNITAGSDGGLYLNVASVAIAETITDLTDVGDGTVTYVNENGVTQKVNKADLTDNGNGTYTFTNGDGTDVLLDTRASSNPYDGTTSGLTATNVQDAIDQVAGGSTDDQQLTLAAGNILTLEDGGTVNLTPFLDNTDNQQITDFSLDNTSNELTLTLEDGGTQTVDFSTILAAADNQQLTLAAGNILTLEDGGTVNLTPFLDNTDNQQITDFSLDNTSNELTLTLEDGGTQTVDFSTILAAADNQQLTLAAGNILTLENGGTVNLTPFLDNTDNQQITDFSLDNTSNELTLTLEDGGTQTVDFSTILAAADNQQLTLAAGNILTLEDGGTVNLTPFLDNTDNQQITDFSLDNTSNELTLTLEDGGTQTVDFSTILAAADNQQLTLAAGNILTLEDGGTVNLTPFLDNTDNQQITDFSLDNTSNELTLTLEDGGTQTVDFSTILAAADNQQLTLAAGNILTLEDGGTVNLTPFLDNTDNQQITDFSLDGTTNILTITLEDGGTQTVNLTGLVGTDDQTAAEVGYDGTTSGLTATNVQAAIDEINTAAGTVALADNGDGSYTFTDAAGGTTTISDTSISTLVNNGDATFTYTDETGTSVTINLISADANNNITAGSDGGLYLNVASVAIAETITDLTDVGDGTVTYVNENGVTQKVNKADLADNGNGTYTFTNGDGTDVLLDTRASSNPYDGTTSGLTATNVQDAIDQVAGGSTDDQQLTLAAGNILTLEDGGTVNLTPFLDNTDNQQITDFSLDNTSNELTLTLEDGGTQTVDFSTILAAADNQQLTLATGNILTLEDGGTVNLTPFLDNTDNQQITDFSLDNTSNELTLTLEDGGTQTVDFSTILAAADNQQLTLAAGNILTLEDGGTVNLTPFLDNTDNQQITDFSLDNTSNELTLTLEDGGTQTVDFSTILAAADNQQLTLAAGNILTLEDGGTVNLTPFLDNTDNQQITDFSLDGATNILTITLEDGGTQTVNLTGLVGTDDQTAAEVGYDGTTSGLTATNVQAAIDEINTAAGTVALADNGDGSYTFTDAAGGTTTISDTSISTLVNNGDATFTYTDETGTSVTINLISADANNNITAGSDGGLYLNVASVAIAETITDLTDVGDGTVTYVNENGVTQKVNKADLTDNGNGTYTFTNGDGTDVLLDTRASSNPYDGTTSGLTATNVQDAIDQVAGGSTDDQQLTLAAGNILTLEDGGTVNLTPFLDNTDNQQITDFSLDNTSNELTLTLEDGGTQTVDFSTILAAADNQQLTLAAGNILTLEDGGTVNLTPFLDNTDNQQITDFSLDNTSNELTLTLEDGGTQTVDFSTILAAADNQQLTLAAGNILTLEDGGTVNLTPFLDNTDNQQITNFSLDNTSNELTLTLEDGGTQTVDFSTILAAADNQQLTLAAGNILTLEDGGTVNLTPFLDNTDNQQITDFSLDGTTNILTITLEDGGTQTVNLTGLVGTDDQTAAEVGYDGTISGLTATNVQAAIDEINTAAGTVALADNGDGSYTFTDAAGGTTTISDTSISTLVNNGDATFTYTDETGTPVTIDLISADANNNITAGSDGGLYLNVASVAIAETITDLTDVGDGTVTYVNENGVTQKVNKADLTDNGNGTYTFTNGDGTDVLLDTRASSNPYDGTTSGLTATNVQDAIDQVAGGSTDDQQLTLAAGNILTLEDGGTVNLTPFLDNTDNQQITDFSLDNTSNELTLTLEDGGTQTVDFSTILAAADNQQLTLAAGNILTLEDGGTVNLTSFLDNTDNQQITDFSLDNTSNELTLTLEDGGTQTVDFSTILAAADNQQLTLAAGNILTLEDGGTVNLTPFLDNTDNQQITDFSLDNTSNELTLTLEDGGTQTVDFSTILAAADNQQLTLAAGNILTLEDGGTVNLTPFLDNTDNQQITDFSLDNTSNELTLTLEDGGTQTVDFSTILAAADNQQLTLAAGNILTLEDGGTVNLTPFLDNTDNQQITDFSLDNTSNELTLTLEDGGTQTVDFSTILAAADNQQLTLAAGNILTLEDGGTVNLTPFLDNTDNQQITDFSLDNTSNELTLTLEDGGTQTVDFSTILAAADNQQLTLAAGNILTLEDGGTVNLTPFLDNTDNQQITDFSLDNTSNELTLTLEDGGTQTVDFSTILAAADNQQLTLAAGNILTLEDGGTVNLTPFLDNTDNQQITDFSLDNTSNELTLTLEDGGTQTVNFSTILAAADNQQLTLAAGNILTLEDGGTVNLTPFLDNTDNQQITDFSLDNTSNELTLTLEDGGTQTVDFSTILAAADNQQLTLAAGNILTLEDGGTVNLTPFLDNTDNQQITDFSLDNTSNELTLTLEDGGTQTVDFSTILAAADNQQLTLAAGNILTLEDGGTVNLTPFLDNTDNQQITDFSLDNTSNELTLTLEDGGTQTVDFSTILAAADNQQLTLAAGNILTLEDGGTVNLTPFLDNTDNQQITDFSLDNTSNELTLTLEDGGTQTVDFSTILAAADNQQLTLAAGNILTLEDGGTVNLTPFLDNTDNQQITDFSLDNTSNELTLTLEDGGTQTVDFSTILAAADNQQLTLAAGNILTLEDGGTVNLTPFLDNTDNQQITDFNLDNTSNELTLTLEDGGTQTVDFSTILAAADNQQLTLAAGNILTLEDGGTVNLTPFLDNTDNQQITDFSLDNTSNELTLTLEDGGTQTVDFSTILAAADNQQLTLAAGNILTLEDGGTVNLTPFLDNTDNQQITDFSLDNTSNELTLTLEDGGTQTVDFSTILAAADNQQLTLAAGNILTLEDGGTVNLTPFLDNTDNQQITDFSLDNTSNELTLTLEDGGTQTVDFSTILAAADDQQLTLAAGNILTLEDGGTVNLTPFLDNTDNQNLTGATLNGSNELQIDIESGSSTTVDLSSLEESADITTNAVNLANHIAADGDLSDTNEIQNLSLVGNDLSISGGNTVTLPSNTNIYTNDGTLAGSRTLTGANNSLTFTNINALQFSSTVAQFFTTGALQLGSTGGITQISGATGIQLQDNTTVQGNINVTGTYGDSSGDAGTSGQILSSTGTGTNWIDVPVDDDQTASEVDSDTPVDVDGDGTVEDTVEDVIQDIAPIVSKAARIFYPPSIAVDASANGTFTIDLHAQYVAQYGSPTVGSAGAPAAVPTYASGELYYYVTFADPTVFDTTSTSGPTQMTIDADGMLTYTIIGQPADFNALINVVFVVK